MKGQEACVAKRKWWCEAESRNWVKPTHGWKMKEQELLIEGKGESDEEVK